ncbi:hypothetical protein FHL15_001330 [Xylaria flabelliformis]|uniref:Uncharacterized protein n=1 Tax=Xylaria flabelliformis TaxID=2512241 RepID=A0A553IBK0_9PEZI|nr:hypothetical protein FHL15_001330 [Xylaria flabelliformis]
MGNNVESPEGVGAVIMADIKTMVAERLREEYLTRFIRLRNVLLLSDRPDGSKTMRLLSQPYVRDLEKKWDSTLQTLRSELPMTLDKLFNSLQPEFQEAAGFPASPLDLASSPPPVSKETRHVKNHTFEPIQFQVAGVSVNTSPATNRARSVTVAPSTTAVKEAEKPSAVNKAENPVSDLADEPSKKRTLDSEEPEITPFSKKSKKTPQTQNGSTGFRMPIKKCMDIQEVKEGECVFSFDNYYGVYVLRCSLVKCKKRLKQDGPIIFTSHPFRDGLAFDHFDGDGHNIESEEEIFRRFAIRGTSTERNTEKKGDSVFDSSSSEADLPSQPLSPTKSRDKGKKPERSYNLHSPRKPEASTSESASRVTETFKESFYRAGPISSIPGSTLPSENSIELPPKAKQK